MALHEQKPLPSVEEIAKLPPDGGPEFNRLIHEKSPYLLQHARNPVDWYPWSKEAFDKARKEDKPIFLSIGYSTCHWCHVMENDSFEHMEVAEILNRYYVCIKVDREERPDLDEIYMNATQLMTNRGGWPNSLWLLPDGRPWYAGTFFPREDVPGRPGFRTILISLAEFWRHRRAEALKQAEQLLEVMRRITGAKDLERMGEPSRELVGEAIRQMQDMFDETNGGFGDAPKFPPHGSLALLFYEYRRTEDDALLRMATRTLDGMAHGGIHDHLGGGFHRYSTDARWVLPHFEKMLYDNAQLARAYVQGYLATGKKDYRDTASKIFGWVLREMTDKGGAFYSALDADSEGVEGKYYVWTYDEIQSALGEREGGLFCRAYNVRPEGNYREEASGALTGLNVLYRDRTFEELAEAEGMPEEEFRGRLAAAREELLRRRDARVRPHLDDKTISGWNGLMIASLAFAGQSLGERAYIKAAERAARFILEKMRDDDGRLQRTYREGEAKLDAFLDDYAFLGDALLDLYEATQQEKWLKEARRFAEALLRDYYDTERGGFFFCRADDEEKLLLRLKDPLDKAIPSGNAVAVRLLVRLGRLTQEQKYIDVARKSFEAFQAISERAPRGVEALLLALALYFDSTSAGTAAAEAAEPPEASVRKKPVRAEAFVSKSAVAPGESIDVAIKLTIDKGWHINSNKPFQEYLAPTTLELQDSPAVSLGTVAYPIGRQFTLDFDPEPVSVYEESAWIVAPLTVAKSAKQGERRVDLNLKVQACSNEDCLVPEQLVLSVPLRVSKEGGEQRHLDIFEPMRSPQKRRRKKKT